MLAMTRRQAEIMWYIQDYKQEHEYSPSIREICLHFGFASTNAAIDHLDRMARNGLLKRTKHIPRSIVLLVEMEVAA